MVKASKGRMSRKSRLLGRNARKRRITVVDQLREFKIGAKVQLVPNAKFEDFPHPRYAGRVGVIKGKQGNAYIVEIEDGGVKKKIITSSVHLKEC
ncbi:MAG: 50S ribosomal protein L21e [Candidatus Omnitrophica bacterium]|nr:50S ribosomal protein L21e [Candidatus Omnitrophota bacterium]